MQGKFEEASRCPLFSEMEEEDEPDEKNLKHLRKRTISIQVCIFEICLIL